MRNIVLFIVGLVIVLLLLVNLTPVQNFIAREATKILAKKLNTKVAIKHVHIDFLNHVLLQGLYIEDQQKDTLLYAGEARVRITDWFVFRGEVPVLRYVGLKDAYARLHRKNNSDKWNYQFVVDAFDTGKKDTTKKQNEFELDLEKINIENVRFYMNDAWVGSDMNFDVGSLVVEADQIDIKKKIIDINSLSLKNAGIALRDYDGGRPPRPKTIKGIDTTAFNSGDWKVNAKSIQLSDCFFKLDAGNSAPTANEFDPEHMLVTDIDLDVKNIAIRKDTLKARMNHLSAKERCGLIVKKMRADVTVSPNASICNNLFLQTNNSRLEDYYAMHYTRFPDFKDYVNKVVMVANFKKASVDAKDVAFFAPALRSFPTILKANGHIAGSVDSLVGRNLDLSDGSSTVKGNIRMIGLPDINRTFIDYTNGEIFATGEGILKYAPDLRNDPSIALEKVTHAYFKGNFTGNIENFAANGTLTTNLGMLQSDVKLLLPGMRSDGAVYSGTVTTAGFNIGALLRQPDLGIVSLKADVKGSAFDPQIAKVDINAFINKFEYKGYIYSNITAKGILERRKFNGELTVDDPNLALVFKGNIDFSDELVKVDAIANLLLADFKKLNLTKDSVVASADFDLNCTGNSIDNFTGYARLYNIDLRRDNHKMDIDSVHAVSSLVDGEKNLRIESNALSAKLKGNYQLSSLAASVQYYIAGYLPNYISVPTKAAPAQNFSFDIKTHEVDSLLGIIIPSIKGFNDATINGTLNTEQQQLTLNATIPYGIISSVYMRNVTIKGDGNFRTLTLNADAENISLGDSILSGSVKINTTLGDDSLSFKIATNSSDEFGTANLNGQAIAHGDSLYLTLLPSDFYLNNTKWEIPAGNQAIFAEEFLLIRNLNIQSGQQQITVNTKDETTKQSLAIETRNLDIAMLGRIFGFADYQPDGRINGDIRIDNLYKDLQVTSNIKATDVKFASDTLGNITINGSYDAAKGIVILDPQTGIYRGNSSIIISGTMGADSTSKQKLNGKVEFNNAPLAWTSPFLVGFMSKVSGNLNGTVNVGGTAMAPDVSGKADIVDAGMRIDFLGTYYTIPKATVSVDNKKIDLGNITLYDQYKNSAILAGSITHNRFKDMRLAINMGSSKFEVINLQENENETFYGNLIAGFQNLSIRGPFDNIAIRITRAMPTGKSHLTIPISSTGDIGSYSYITFVSYGTQQAPVKKNKNKLNITIDARLNPLAEITLLLDPTTGDAINARGNGNLNMEIPVGNDIRMYGNYVIEEGDYTFTFKQLFFKRNFKINPNSQISFGGLMSQTNLDVDAIYTTRARLYDLLSSNERQTISNIKEEYEAVRRPQDVNVILHMKGPLDAPLLSFNLDLPDKRFVGSYAYTKLERINQNDKDLFDQVAALLLVNTFITNEGSVGNAATSGAINNVSEILSSTASSQLTNIVNKLTGNNDLSIDLKYKSYNFSDVAGAAGVSRNEVTVGLRQNLFSDRLVVEVGSAYDWGRPTTNNNSSNFNPVGDFRAQYLVTPNGNVRLSVFHTSSYDVLLDDNIDRNGIGISFKKTFNRFSDFFKPARKTMIIEEPVVPRDTTQPASTSATY